MKKVWIGFLTFLAGAIIASTLALIVVWIWTIIVHILRG